MTGQVGVLLDTGRGRSILPVAVQSAAAPRNHLYFSFLAPAYIMIIVLDERHKQDLAFFHDQEAESSCRLFLLIAIVIS